MLTRLIKSILVLAFLSAIAISVFFNALSYETKFAITEEGRNWQALADLLIVGFLLGVVAALYWLSGVHQRLPEQWRSVIPLVGACVLGVGLALHNTVLVLIGAVAVLGLAVLAMINGGRKSWSAFVAMGLATLGFVFVCTWLTWLIMGSYYLPEGG